MSDRVPVIGLVGGVGSGKSTVGRLLEQLGCVRIDGDVIGHEVLRQGEVVEQIAGRWGRQMLDAQGQVDRRRLAQVVFADPAEMAALNAIMHPRIGAEIERQVAAARARPGVPAVVVDAAVLLEAGWDDVCTHLLFVRADDATRRARAAARPGWDETHWRQRETAQFPIDRKAVACSYELDNSSSLAHLQQRVREFFRQITHPTDPPA